VRLNEEEPHFIMVDLLIVGYLSDDRVVINGVPIGGRAGPLIRFVITGYLKAA
jgi:hypothetical protein